MIQSNAVFPGREQREKEKEREVGHALVSCGNPTQHRCVSPGVLAGLLSIEKLDKVVTHSVSGGYCPKCVGKACAGAQKECNST